MTEVPGAASPYNLFWWLPAGQGSQAASGETPSAGLVQPILPGWSFGNVIVNETNSSAPDTEQRIVASKSYGHQIGVLLDAVAALIADPVRNRPETLDALKAVTLLEKQVNQIKAEAMKARIDRIETDLDALRDKPDPTEYRAAAHRLQAYLAKNPPAKSPPSR